MPYLQLDVNDHDHAADKRRLAAAMRETYARMMSVDIRRTSDLVIIQITFNEGRTTAQKQALYKAAAEKIQAATGLGISDVFISLVEVKRENWSFGNGVAQYAST